MGILKKHWSLWAVLLIILAAVTLRLVIYGDLRLSIANNDTASYASPAGAGAASWKMFTGRRLFTTNLLYRAFRPEGGYEILANGSAETIRRRIQPSFVSIVLLQNVASVLGWGVLALLVAGRLENIATRILAALVLLCFAFTPQLADWDSVLSSESLTFSLFALQFGLLVALAFAFHDDPAPTPGKLALLGLWLVIVFLWTFLKDGNLYNLLVTGLMLAGLLLSGQFRRQKALYFVLAVLAGIFVLGWVTSGQSVRTRIQLLHIYDVNLLSAPARAQSLRDLGMPERSSKNFTPWFRAHGKNAYLRFLVAHPGYVVTLYARDSLRSFYDNLQPYFSSPGQPVRQALVPFGNALHPTDPAPLLLDALLLSGVWLVALRKRTGPGLVWAWLATWLLLSAHANLFLAIFGDTYALTRHALPAAASFHLFLWLFTIVLIELALLPTQETATAAVPLNS